MREREEGVGREGRCSLLCSHLIPLLQFGSECGGRQGGRKGVLGCKGVAVGDREGGEGGECSGV